MSALVVDGAMGVLGATCAIGVGCFGLGSFGVGVLVVYILGTHGPGIFTSGVCNLGASCIPTGGKFSAGLGAGQGQ